METMNNENMSVIEFAGFCNCTRQTVYNMIRDGLPHWEEKRGLSGDSFRKMISTDKAMEWLKLREKTIES